MWYLRVLGSLSVQEVVVETLIINRVIKDKIIIKREVGTAEISSQMWELSKLRSICRELDRNRHINTKFRTVLLVRPWI